MSKTTELAGFKEWLQTLEAHDIERWLMDDFWHDRLGGSEFLRAFLLSRRGVDMRTKCKAYGLNDND